MNRNISSIIHSAYGRIYGLDQHEAEQYESDRHELVTRRRFSPATWEPFVAFTRNYWARITLISSAIILAVGSVYYYNQMLIAQYSVESASGNVKALMERRQDTSVNLSMSVFHYTVHEWTVLTDIVRMRADMTRDHYQQQPLPGNSDQISINPNQSAIADNDNPAAPKTVQAGVTDSKTHASAKIEPVDPKNMGISVKQQEVMKLASAFGLKPVGGLLALSEDHPDLKSTGPFLTLMTSLTDVEKDLAAARLKYNDQVNIYTTTITMFPNNIFAKIFGFKPVPYYEATKEAMQFAPIIY
jgi:hypothetical protein